MESNKTKNIVLLMPSFLLVFLITAYTVINTLKESLGLIPELFLNNLTLKYYGILFSNKVFIRSLLFSLLVALSSALLSAIFGTILGYSISKLRNQFVHTLYRIPIVMSYIAAAALVYNTFSDKGLLYHLLRLAGVKTTGLNIIYNSRGLAVIILNLFKGIPFVAFTIYPILEKNNKAYKEVARNLGCTNFKYLIKILLPLCKRAILSSTLIIFNYNLFSYESFYYLGPSNPPSIGVLAYNTYLNPDMTYRAYGMAINMIMIIISLLLCCLYYRLLKSENI